MSPENGDIKLVIGIPTTGLVSMGFAYSLCGLTSYIAAKGILSRPEARIEVSLDIQESSVIHKPREMETGSFSLISCRTGASR